MSVPECLLLTGLAIAGSLPHLSILCGFRNQPYLIVLSDQMEQENKVRCPDPFRLHFVVKRGRIPLGPLTHFQIFPNFCKSFYSSSPALSPVPPLSVGSLIGLNKCFFAPLRSVYAAKHELRMTHQSRPQINATRGHLLFVEGVACSHRNLAQKRVISLSSK